MATSVVFIGAGKLGAAIGSVLKGNGQEAAFWDVMPGKVPDQRPLEELLPKAEAVFFCVPSWALREAVKAAASHLRRGTTAVSVSKGLEKRTRMTAEEILEEEAPSARFVFLGGPLLADEIAAGQAAVGVAASKDRRARELVSGLFRGTKLLVEPSSDVEGVVWSAVLKNIYALGLGVAEGLGWGSNAKGWYVSAGCAEASTLLKKLGGKPGTFLTSAGLGDLVATGLSPHSMNRRAGEELARTGRCAVQSEGCATMPLLLERLGATKGFPLLEALRRIVLEAAPAGEAFAELLK